MTFGLLGAHAVGDYFLQTDDMAVGKKKTSLWCSWHVLTYMLPFGFCGLEWWQLLLIAAQHWIQDRTGFVIWFMRLKGSEKFAQPPFGPWSIVLTDNILHLLWIAAVVADWSH